MSQGEARMSWFLSRSQARSDRPIEETILFEMARRGRVPDPEPALILLATDGEGAGCRRLHCFADADSATRFVRFWYPYRADGSLGGFWLLGTEPVPVDRAEWDVVVLIIVRSARSNHVYAFNRRDMESTREFLREEIAYGLNPQSVILSWAVPVEIETDFRGEAVLFPRSLPEGVTVGNPAISALDERELAMAPAFWAGKRARSGPAA